MSSYSSFERSTVDPKGLLIPAPLPFGGRPTRTTELFIDARAVITGASTLSGTTNTATAAYDPMINPCTYRIYFGGSEPKRSNTLQLYAAPLRGVHRVTLKSAHFPKVDATSYILLRISELGSTIESTTAGADNRAFAVLPLGAATKGTLIDLYYRRQLFSGDMTFVPQRASISMLTIDIVKIAASGAVQNILRTDVGNDNDSGSAVLANHQLHLSVVHDA